MVLRFPSYDTNSETLASSSAAPISKEEDNLYQRLILHAHSTVSILPIIKQWVSEGKSVKYEDLKKAIKQLKALRRFKHALQIYEWINNSERLYLSPGDVAVRLDLISKANGLKAAEKYFASTPDILRASCVYGALLNCYADAKSWSKVEGTMQKMRDLQDATLVTYTIMMNLYAKMGNLEKLHLLVQEMEYKGIAGDSISYNIRLNAYASVPDVIGMEKLLMKMEEDPPLIEWDAYAVAAKGYMKAGDVEKASELDDIDGSEKIFAEWEADKVNFDIRIPNFLICIYCKKGHLEKAESVIERLLESGLMRRNYRAWDDLAQGYCSQNQMEKAVETLKRAILVIRTRFEDFLIESVICEFLKFLGLNPMLNWCFDVVLSVPKIGTTLNDVLGLVGMFG
ncbi:pentatricopeptide repeat-containing protein, mitochondrial [Nicotiana attenuata]|uniref:Pentatricopeptide repeat-containing protein, mitochondrial n=1 Tax=Nicotiana attenuata TaxID=49451 RepID=A0A314KTJ1_NICAT|nr:pentatricopeptide repeat-containing protein, mitochondrial [Nicotiana attenuata]